MYYEALTVSLFVTKIYPKNYNKPLIARFRLRLKALARQVTKQSRADIT